MKQDCPTANPALKGKGKGADKGGGKGWQTKGGNGWQQKGKGKGGKGWQQKGLGKGLWSVDDIMGQYNQQQQSPQEGSQQWPSQEAWGGPEDWWQNGVGSLSLLAQAKTDGNKYSALRESDLATPSTTAVEVPFVELMRPPTKRQQRRMSDNRKISIIHSLKCCEECRGQEQEAFPELGALKWGGKTA